jgi:predicted phage tail protein
MGKQKLKDARSQTARPLSAAKLPPLEPAQVPPLFRAIDWLAMMVAFGVIWIVYFLTLAPEQTLEDSGELCTGAFYAGIPHPPGYPFWSIYAWLWTKLLPMGNVAWRVEVGEATAAALACGLVAMMVSRGSSMLMEGIEELREMTGKWESAICLVSGTVAGLLLGLGGVMWSESVAINRISLFGVPWVMIVLLCLMRWIYAPHQHRYLYVAMFFFGICATIHQTLLVAAMGIEAAIIAAQPKLGRDVLFGNSLIYLALLYAYANHLVPSLLEALGNPIVRGLFHIIGVGSIAGCIALIIQTKKLFTEWWPCLVMLGLYALGVSFYFYMPIAGMTCPPMQWGYPRTVEGFFHALSRGQYEKANPSNPLQDPGRFIMQLGILIWDVAGEFNWVLVFVALVPVLFFLKMQKRERAWIIGLVSIYLCIGVLLMVLMNVTPDRQTSELNKVFFISSHGIIAIMVGYGLALTAAYMATHFRRFRIVGLMLGIVTLVPAFITLYNGVSTTFYGSVGLLSYDFTVIVFICLAAAFVLAALAAQYFIRTRDSLPGMVEDARLYFLGFSVGAAISLSIAVILVFFQADSLSIKQILTASNQVLVPGQFSLPAIAGLLVVGVVMAFVGSLFVYRQRAPLVITLGLFAIMPIASGLSHWAHSEQRNHWFGYWFGHDMFTPPFPGPDGKLTYDAKLREQAMKGTNAPLIYPEMDKDTILFGGTDPGRFCPTYMIFCDSFIPHDCQPLQDQAFDRRDVYLITQNALADGTYLCYLRSQYFRSQQKDPPFFSELARTLLKDDAYQTNFMARLVSPLDTYFMARGARIEKRWRTSTSLFTDSDFANVTAIASRLRSSQDPLYRWLFQNLNKPAKDLITSKGSEAALRAALVENWNQLLEGPLICNSNRFAQVKLSDYLKQFIAQNPQGDTRIRLNRLLLEAAFPEDIAKSQGGVYPDREIYIPSPEDSQRCFGDYMEDVQRRMRTGQMMPGENVNVDASGKMQVSGQVAVMMINGLLCKVIFDRNPNNEFYIEESFPLPWMYPYETPYGIIMKINRQPLSELSEEILRRDHFFWSKYADRLIGNWITYDTSVKQVVDFIEKTYLRHDYSGFQGDLKFVRDDQAQKAFSKLRSSITGVFAWRLGPQCPEEYRQKSSATLEALKRETDFAFKQAFAFCPYSPEAVFRYINFLLQYGRVDDAFLVAQTCQKLDPYNDQVKGLVKQLGEYKNQSATRTQVETQVQRMESELRTNPDNMTNVLSLASFYQQMQQTNRTIALFDLALANPRLNATEAGFIAQSYAQMGNLLKLEGVIEKLTMLAPQQPEPWYDLAALEAVLGKRDQALLNLGRSLELSTQRLKTNSSARNLMVEVRNDQRFDSLRNLPAFQNIVPPN